MRLELDGVHGGYGKARIVDGVSMSLDGGEVACLLGPNGAGKTTLFKGLLGLVPFRRGRVLCDGEDMASWPRARIARTIGYIPQSHVPAFQYKALGIVLMGRSAHIGRFGTPSKKDVAVAEQALETLGLSHLRNTLFMEMSGGERQLVLIARSLAQKPKFLVMDEPTNNLDFGNQVRVLRHIADLARGGLGIMMASHYPDHAFQYASKVVLLKGGRIIGSGTPEDIVTENRLNSLYGVRISIADALVGNGERSVRVCVPWAREPSATRTCGME